MGSLFELLVWVRCFPNNVWTGIIDSSPLSPFLDFSPIYCTVLTWCPHNLNLNQAFSFNPVAPPPKKGVTERVNGRYVCVCVCVCARARVFITAGVVKNLGWMFILFPVLFDCIIIMIMGKHASLSILVLARWYTLRITTEEGNMDVDRSFVQQLSGISSVPARLESQPFFVRTYWWSRIELPLGRELTAWQELGVEWNKSRDYSLIKYLYTFQRPMA